ncbi:MAG: phosphoadenylyl-sulfate reductase, partial [Gemmatimonadota bacterium]
WTLERFGHQRVVITTSFGMEGCALVDLYAARSDRLTVVYADTGFFFPETYALRDRLVERYPHVEFVNRGTSLTPEEQALRYGPDLWRGDPDRCCQLRRVEPLRRVLANADVWITGITRSQGKARSDAQLIGWDWTFGVLKINPLVSWDRTQVWDHIQRYDVPSNPLHERGYPTIGCTHCTVPVAGLRIGEYSRSGRWAGTEKTECGLHQAPADPSARS